MTRTLLLIVTLIIGTGVPFGDRSFARTQGRVKTTENLVAKAQEQFSKKKYRRAITLYRRYLRKNRKDADVWSQLAVTYLYSGQPQTALNFLRRWIKRTTLKAYNEYHQGLAYLATGYPDKAKIAFTRAARFNDEFAGRATYELLVQEYNARDVARAQYWVNLYKQRYPNGAYIRDVTRIDQSLRNKSFIEGLKGNPKPDIEDAMFKYHRLSLYPKPHYWFLRTGYEFVSGTQTDPNSDPTQPIKENPISDHNLLVHAGIGMGPIEQGGSTSWIGYNYKQDWRTNDARLQGYFQNLGDSELIDYIVYFPFRPDLLERTHELYGEVRYPIEDKFFVGLFGMQDFKFIGSELVPGVDQLEIEQKRASLSDSTTIIPSFGVNYYQNFQTLVFLYLKKEINKEAPEFSTQSYNLFGRGDPFVSYGISHRMSFPEYQFNVAAEAFQYEFIFNDLWLDYTRTGFLLGAEFQFEPNLWVHAAFGMYTDEYIIPVLRQKSCDFAQKGDQTSTEPTECTRTDEGTIIQAGLFWDYSKFLRIATEFKMIENSNPTLKVYERSELIALVSATWAFPSARRVLRFLDRFGDVALTKEPGD